MSSQIEPPSLQDFIAVVFLFDTSIDLGSQWIHVLSHYLSPLFRRLSELGDSVRAIRMGVVAYTLPNMNSYSPILQRKFFSELGQIAEILKEPHKLGVGSTLSGGKDGMPALEGFATAIEMLDTLTNSCPMTSPGRPINLNIIHLTAALPDTTVKPQWNDMESLDDLTWESLPTELSSRNINFSTIVLNPDTSVYKGLHASGAAQAWFAVRPPHTIYLSPYFSTPVPTTSKRPAEATSPENNAKKPRLDVKPVVPSIPGLPGRLSRQDLHNLALRLRTMEESAAKLEAGLKEAKQVGDAKKAETLAADIVKHKTASKTLRDFLTMQVRQQQAIANGQQQPIKAQPPNAPQVPLHQQTTEQPQPQPQTNEPQNQNQNQNQARPPSQPKNPTPNQQTKPIPQVQVQPNPTPSFSPQKTNLNLPPNAPNAAMIGGARMPMEPELAAQMNKLVQQHGRQPMHGNPAMMAALQNQNQNQNSRMGMPQLGASGMGAGIGGIQPGQVPVWQGTMFWRVDAVNGMRDLSVPMQVHVLTPTNIASHSETWPKTIHLSPSEPINPSDVQAWFAQHKDTMFLGKIMPAGPDSSAARDMWASIGNLIMNNRIYLTGAWTTPNGGQTKNLLMTCATNNGLLLGAFYPHNGLPELPKPTGPLNYPPQSQPQPQPGQMHPSPSLQPPNQPPGPGPQHGIPPHQSVVSGPNSVVTPDIRMYMEKVRQIPEDNQRAFAVHQVLTKVNAISVQQGRGPLQGPDMTMLMGAMNVNPQQVQALSAQARRLTAMQGQGQGQGLLQPQRGPGQQQLGGMMGMGMGGLQGGPGGMNMGGPGGAGGGMFNPLLAQAMMNAQRGNMGGMGNLNLGQQMMGGTPGMQGPGAQQGNVSMEMMQSFAQRNQNGGMGHGPG